MSTINAQSQTPSDKLIRQGVALHDKGRYKEAIGLYEEALSHLKLKNYEKALNYSSQVIHASFQPLLMDAYIVRGTAFADMNNNNEAIKVFTEAVERCGDEYLLLFNLGLCYFNNKDYRTASQHLRKAIEIDPTHSSAFLLYA